eukprot:782149-Rhodomonas_salina.4
MKIPIVAHRRVATGSATEGKEVREDEKSCGRRLKVSECGSMRWPVRAKIEPGWLHRRPTRCASRYPYNSFTGKSHTAQ